MTSANASLPAIRSSTGSRRHALGALKNDVGDVLPLHHGVLTETGRLARFVGGPVFRGAVSVTVKR